MKSSQISFFLETLKLCRREKFHDWVILILFFFPFSTNLEQILIEDCSFITKNFQVYIFCAILQCSAWSRNRWILILSLICGYFGALFKLDIFIIPNHLNYKQPCGFRFGGIWKTFKILELL